MKDNKEMGQLNLEEEKDISGGMNIDSKKIINKLKSKFKTEIIKPIMMYGGPNIKPNLMKYGINTEPKYTVEELVPNSSENSNK